MTGLTRASQLLWMFALAVVMIVCGRGAVSSHASAAPVATVTVAIEVLASWSADSRAAWTPAGPSRQWRDGASHLAVDLRAVEADLDDDGDDRQCDPANDGLVGLSSLSSPRMAGRASRAEPPPDTSRFASGTGLPRGPPV